MLDRSNILAWCLLLAVLLHWALRNLPSPVARSAAKADDSLKLEDGFVVERYDDSRPVVQTSRPSEQREDSRPARFYGEFKNRVEREMKSPLTGRFRPGSRVPGGGVSGGDRGNVAPGLSELLGQRSASPSRLPSDIPEGSETLLNTDAVLYASYINRVADEIYDPWVHYAQRAVDAIYSVGKKLETQTYVTKLAVLFNREGGVASIRVLKSCGVAELDDAPKKAFWDVEPFPNPPLQMFGPDGFIKFVYEFHFEWQSASFNIVPLI